VVEVEGFDTPNGCSWSGTTRVRPQQGNELVPVTTGPKTKGEGE
jgi:hypothetical protein